MRPIQRSAVPWLMSAAYLISPAVWPDEMHALDPEPAAHVASEERDTTQSGPGPASQDADTALGSVDAASDESLAEARGGADLSVNENNLDATMEGNVASNLSTGNNTITESAFSNATGIPMVIQNSGNNVIIQNSTILNLQLN